MTELIPKCDTCILRYKHFHSSCRRCKDFSNHKPGRILLRKVDENGNLI